MEERTDIWRRWKEGENCSDIARATGRTVTAARSVIHARGGITPSPRQGPALPRYADVLMGITNTLGTLPGILGVIVTGWLLDVTGSYGSAFLLAAIINGLGAIVWLIFATGERVVE